MPSCGKWLTLIGIGEDGIDALSPAARRLLAQAQLVIGGARHIALAGPLSSETMTWPSPIAAAIPQILARRGSPVCVLASGDPFFYGVGTLLSAHISEDEMQCLPAPSAFSLAAARLNWSLQELPPYLPPWARIRADHSGVAAPCENPLFVMGRDDAVAPGKLLTGRGLGQSRIAVMEAMGGPKERIRVTTAGTFNLEAIDPLNLVAIEITATRRTPEFFPLQADLPMAGSKSDGQLTKREVRAISLSSLAPRRGELLWDVGAGSGSIAIEWLLSDPANQAIAIEARADRASRIARNALNLGVPHLEIITGRRRRPSQICRSRRRFSSAAGQMTRISSTRPMPLCLRRKACRQCGHP